MIYAGDVVDLIICMGMNSGSVSKIDDRTFQKGEFGKPPSMCNQRGMNEFMLLYVGGIFI